MKFQKLILLSLLIFWTFFVVSGQKSQVSPTPQIDDEVIACPLYLIGIIFSILNNKGNDVKSLDRFDFEIYYKKQKQEIEYFKFDELKNQYNIGFFPDDYVKKIKSDDIKVKLKLSEEKKKQYGKVSIKMKTEK